MKSDKWRKVNKVKKIEEKWIIVKQSEKSRKSDREWRKMK